MHSLFLISALLLTSGSAHRADDHEMLKRFGTVDGKLGQNAEHEHITRAAFACAAGQTAADGNCFEPHSLDQIAGHTGNFGGVGAPDTPPPEGAAAHCDEADFIDIPGYPRTRAEANVELNNCITHLFNRFQQGITGAAGLLDDKKKIIPKEVEIVKADGSAKDCTFYGGLSGRAKCDAIDGLGRALHGVQDFYSHSNWADHSRDREVHNAVNPPGLGLGVLAWFFNFVPGSPSTFIGIPANLSTGCFTLLGDTTPGSWGCKNRVTHHTLNKDHGIIDANGVATVTGTDTPRSDIVGNFQAAVSMAIADSKRQWESFKDKLKFQYGAEKGNRMICAIVRDDPVKSCYGRRVALVIDSSGSNTWTDPGNFRIAAARQFNSLLITKASAGPGELPDQSAVIDFDDSAAVISPMDDPSLAYFDSIDSYGGTYIALGLSTGIDEIINTRPPHSSNVPYEENKAGIVLLTDGDDHYPGERIHQINRAAALKIRISYGFLSAPVNPVPLKGRDLQPEKRAASATNIEILTAILESGGIFATINSAEAQQNFVQLVNSRGLTAINGAATDPIELLPGLFLDRLISAATGSETFYYIAVAGEKLRLTVTDNSATVQMLAITVIDVNTNVAVTTGLIDNFAPFVFPFTSATDATYRIIVSSPSAGTSVYTIGFESSIPIRVVVPPSSLSDIASSTVIPETSTSDAVSSTISIGPLSTGVSSSGFNVTTSAAGGYNASTTTTSLALPATTIITVATSVFTTICPETLTSDGKLITITRTSTITSMVTSTVCHQCKGPYGDHPRETVPYTECTTKTITASPGPGMCYLCAGPTSLPAGFGGAGGYPTGYGYIPNLGCSTCAGTPIIKTVAVSYIGGKDATATSLAKVGAATAVTYAAVSAATNAASISAPTYPASIPSISKTGNPVVAASTSPTSTTATLATFTGGSNMVGSDIWLFMFSAVLLIL